MQSDGSDGESNADWLADLERDVQLEEMNMAKRQSIRPNQWKLMAEKFCLDAVVGSLVVVAVDQRERRSMDCPWLPAIVVAVDKKDGLVTLAASAECCLIGK